MLPDGTTGYAETHIVPFTDLTLTDVSMTTYINTNNVPLSSDAYEMGLYESTTKAILLAVKNPSPDYEYSFRYNGAIGTASSTTAAAMHTITRTSTSGYIYKDGVEEHTFTADGTALPTANLKTLLLCNIGVNSGGSPAGVYSNGWSNQRQVFTSIGDGLSADEAANLNTIVEAYQVALGRNN
jgi:hypothetical protein